MKINKKMNQQFIYWLSVVILGLTLGLAVQFVQAWTEPILPPPAGNVPAPLNISGTTQVKAGTLAVNSNGNTVGFVVGSGNVGIGTGVPRSKLDVRGGIRTNKGIPSVGDSANVGYAFAGDGDTGMFTYGGADWGGSNLALYIDNQERLTIINNGNVGINDTDPDAQLDIRGNGSSNAFLVSSQDESQDWLKIESNGRFRETRTLTPPGGGYWGAHHVVTTFSGAISGDIPSYAPAASLYLYSSFSAQGGSYDLNTAGLALHTRIESGSDINSTRAIYSQVLNYATTPSITGVFSQLFQDRAVTVNNFSAFHGSMYVTAGTINNAYGLFIGGLTGTNQWGVYVEDTDAKNYFGGNVGIGTANPGYKLQVQGNAANTTGVWANISDVRLKENIRPIEGALGTILKLQGVTFNWKDKSNGEGLQRGFIAQDVENVIPEWVKTGADGYKMTEKIGIDALMVEAIKEQQKQIEELKARIEELENR